jgi:hypothetical protein
MTHRRRGTALATTSPGVFAPDAPVLKVELAGEKSPAFFFSVPY